MCTAKDEIQLLLQKLPDDCTLEGVQYHLYVLGKIRRGIERAESEGAVSQEEVERRLAKWIHGKRLIESIADRLTGLG